MDRSRFRSLGWERDLPDVRDFSEEHEKIGKILTQSARLKTARKTLPPSADLRSGCSPVEDQGQLGSCTAHAGVGLMEYFQRNAFGTHLEGSRLFLYKTTRKLLGWNGDDGAYLRTTMKAMALFGICPEAHWPYRPETYNDEPTAFCYALGQSYQATDYYRIDPPGVPAKEILGSVKEKCAAGLPSMFGFSVYSSIPTEEGEPDIPFPGGKDRLEGGHAVMAVGYDDKRKIGKCTGALLIRNSWGRKWGDAGYGWLPYEYVMEGLAVDFWSLADADFVDTGLFSE